MKTPHPYAEILRAIADGETVQWKPDGQDWQDTTAESFFLTISHSSPLPSNRLRIKPRTIRVGEVDVPMGITTAPQDGEGYWIAMATDRNFYVKDVWGGYEMEKIWLSRGLIYSNPTDAETAGRAIAALFAKDKS